MAESPLVELQKALYTSKNPTRRWLHVTRRDKVLANLRYVAESSDTIKRAIEVGPGSGVYLPDLCRLADNVLAVGRLAQDSVSQKP